jgi:FdhD protein
MEDTHDSPLEFEPAPTRIDVLRWKDGRVETAADLLAQEEPLEIRIDTHSISITLRTPGHDAELAIGFLVTEGLLTAPDQIRRIQPYPRNALGNVVDIQLAPDVPVDLARLTRHVFTSSSCGLCGKTQLESVHQQFPPLPPFPDPSDVHTQAGDPHSRAATSLRPRDTMLTSETLLHLPNRMRSVQTEFTATGGLHAAALFDCTGNLLVLREDVGRHNAVDKVLGWAFQNHRFPLDNQVLLVSGRVSFEIVQKALAARIPILAAVSAPSSLAVALAQASHQTLIGFLRPGRFNVYSCPERLNLEPTRDSSDLIR